jgi:hypothetical protein
MDEQLNAILAQMKELAGGIGDPERAHRIGDKLLIAALLRVAEHMPDADALLVRELIAQWTEIRKWYA